jgi:hypothetical protein
MSTGTPSDLSSRSAALARQLNNAVGVIQQGLICGLGVERVTRIELALSAWEADVLPLNYTRERSAPSLTAAVTGMARRPAWTCYRMVQIAVGR